MPSNHRNRLLALIAAIIAVGAIVDTARAQQFSKCQLPAPGCVAVGCTFTIGNCVGGPAYIGSTVNPVNYSSCNLGNINDCRNVLVPSCTQTFFDGNVMNKCITILCTLVSNNIGC